MTKINTVFKKEKTEWKYICNICFNYKEKCICNRQTSCLGIDSNIIKCLQILHSKNYQTVSCCEGHLSTYKTQRGITYTNLSDTYITFDIHSLEDIKKELSNVDWEILKLEILPDGKRYQLNVVGMRVKGDKYDKLLEYKHNNIHILENIFNKFKKRRMTEEVIITNY